ncbi:hypothetical protein FQN50_007965 [Emmonsiellopsis sp. PD_5]|nr:hypothetical protein FQN50_007965 [Emmonsiellopsis sp. PD_5]
MLDSWFPSAAPKPSPSPLPTDYLNVNGSVTIQINGDNFLLVCYWVLLCMQFQQNNTPHTKDSKTAATTTELCAQVGTRINSDRDPDGDIDMIDNSNAFDNDALARSLDEIISEGTMKLFSTESNFQLAIIWDQERGLICIDAAAICVLELSTMTDERREKSVMRLETITDHITANLTLI